MAQKKITDLQLIDEVDDSINIPGDDGIQTYRLTGAQIREFLTPFYSKNPGLIKNVGLLVTASAGAMTVSLKQSDGSTNPTSGLNATEVTFRSNTLTSGAITKVTFDAALSLVIPSTATMGFKNGQNARVFCYLYYDGTNKGWALTPKMLDESQLYTLTQISTGADALGPYADDNRTNAAVRLVGYFSVNAITTAGTWTSPTYVHVHAGSLYPERGLIDRKVFTSSGTYNRNPYADFIVVTVIGGGGGGGGVSTTSAGQGSCAGGGAGGGTSVKKIANSSVGDTETVTVGAGGNGGAVAGGNGTAGGTSSFGAHCSATGGGAGAGSAASSGGLVPGGSFGGVGSGGDYNFYGDSGGPGGNVAGNVNTSGYGGGSYHGGTMLQAVNNPGNTGTPYGGGGSGACNAASQTQRTGGPGSAGIVIVEEYKY